MIKNFFNYSFLLYVGQLVFQRIYFHYVQGALDDKHELKEHLSVYLDGSFIYYIQIIKGKTLINLKDLNNLKVFTHHTQMLFYI
jgi:hypothetical protein